MTEIVFIICRVLAFVAIGGIGTILLLLATGKIGA